MFFQNYDDRKNTTSLKTIKIQMVLDHVLTRFEYRSSICNNKRKRLDKNGKKKQRPDYCYKNHDGH